MSWWVSGNGGGRARFSVVDSLLIVVVLAVLGAVLFPVLEGRIRRARDRADEAGCMGNLEQLGVAMAMYAEDWDGRLPVSRASGGNPAGNWAGCYERGGRCDPAEGQLFAYTGRREVYLCPRLKERSSVVERLVYGSGDHRYPLSYSMNTLLSGCVLGKVAVPGRVGLLVEESAGIDDGDFDWMGWTGDKSGGRDEPGAGHRDGAFVLYCDMHVVKEYGYHVRKELREGAWNPGRL